MASHVQLNLPPTPVQSIGPARTIDSPASGPRLDLSGTNGLSLLVEATQASGCPDKTMAISLGLPDPSYWSKVKSGEKPAPRITQLTNVPESVQREYVRRWGRQLGMRVSEADPQRQAAVTLVKAAAEFLAEVG
jgi:hypothetical protein